MLTKKALIDTVAGDTELAKATVERVLENAGQHIALHLAVDDDHRAVIPGLGRLVVKTRAGRTGRHPKTGAAIVLPARRVVKFRAGKELAAAIED